MKLDQAKRDEIRACLLSGMPMKQTARQCGVNYPVVSRERRIHNLPLIIGGPNKKISESKIEEINALVAQGKTIVQIAAACNVSTSTVARYRLKCDVPKPTNTPISEEKKKRIIQLLLDGVSVAETASMNGISFGTVQRLKFLNDVSLPGEERMYDPNTVKMIQEQILALPPGDASDKKIAVDCDTTVTFVKLVKKKMGICDHKIRKDKVEKVVQCMTKRMSADAAAKECGVSVQSVRNICKERNIEIPNPRFKYISPAAKETMKKRLEQGHSASAVARTFGITKVRLERMLNIGKSRSKNVNCKPDSHETHREGQMNKRLLRSGMSVNEHRSTSARVSSKRIKFVNEIPFSILI
ncbi:hypothetical protein BC940DRAFT_306832 [Gongronella butleri]|nr:hypothetical protein BC940DRAFT_306832 [Gongronella butleri]